MPPPTTPGPTLPSAAKTIITEASDPTPILTLPSGHTARPFLPFDTHPQIAGLNNPAVRKYMRTRIPNPLTEADAMAWIEHSRDRRNWIRSGLFQQDIPTPEDSTPLVQSQYAISSPAGLLIGAIGLTQKDDIYFRTVELGYWLSEEWWGRGVMSSVVRGFVGWIWKTLGVVWRIEAVVFEGNEGSRAVLRRAGFRLEGVKRGAVWKDGEGGGEEVWGCVRGMELGPET